MVNEAFPKMELGICGLMMNEPSAIGIATQERIIPEYFSSPVCGEVFRVMMERSKNLEGIDLASMLSALPDHDECLTEMELQATGQLLHLRDWCIQIRKAHAVRTIAKLCEDAKKQIALPDADPVEVGNNLIGSLFETTGMASKRHIPTNRELAIAIAERRLTNKPLDLIAVFPDYTEAGQAVKIERGNFYTIAAETKAGKTTIAITMAINALRAGKRVAYFCAETSSADIADAFVDQVSGVKDGKQHGNLSPVDVGRVKLAIEELFETHKNDLKIVGMDAGRLTPAAVMAHLRQFAQLGTIDLCVIDYLQRFKADKPSDNDYHDLNSVIESLHQIFIQFNVGGLVLAQFNRSAASPGQKQDDMPKLSWIKGSSLIEQESHAVAFFHHPGGDKSQTILFCNTSRKFDLYTIPLRFDGVRYISNNATSAN